MKLKLKLKSATLLTAALLPAWATAQEDSGRWVLKEPAVLEDTFTGLQWTQRDSLGDTNWNAAKSYCAALSWGGGGWRLPTMQELSQVDTGGRDGTTPCGGSVCKVSPKFYLTGPWFWSGDQGDSSSEAWNMHLNDGNRYSGPVSTSLSKRALCVRRRS